jgi:trehalose 6-phosphate synthase/phosphatase
MNSNFDRPLIFGTYKNAERRILFFDYDGTLVPFSNLPEKSELGNEVRQIIVSLSYDQKNTIYIISGRKKDFLERQFLGIRTGLIAEHGFMVKEIDGGWKSTIPVNEAWKKDARDLLQNFAVRHPGSFIEEKESSIAYHYRTAGKNAGIRVRPVIRRHFQALRHQYPYLELLEGNKVTEIKPESYNKGSVATSILRNGSFDFVMAAGDDLTDEQLFSVFTHDCFTIKIGKEPTCARYRFSNQEKFIGFLKELQKQGK